MFMRVNRFVVMAIVFLLIVSPAYASFEVGQRVELEKLRDTFPVDWEFSADTAYYKLETFTEEPYKLTLPNGTEREIYLAHYKQIPPQPVQILLVLRPVDGQFKIIKTFDKHWFPNWTSFSALDRRYLHLTIRGGQSHVEERFFGLIGADTLYPIKEVHTAEDCHEQLRVNQPKLYKKLKSSIILEEGFLNLWNSGAHVEAGDIKVTKNVYTKEDANCCPSYQINGDLTFEFPEEPPNNYPEGLPVIKFESCTLGKNDN